MFSLLKVDYYLYKYGLFRYFSRNNEKYFQEENSLKNVSSFNITTPPHKRHNLGPKPERKLECSGTFLRGDVICSTHAED